MNLPSATPSAADTAVATAPAVTPLAAPLASGHASTPVESAADPTTDATPPTTPRHGLLHWVIVIAVFSITGSLAVRLSGLVLKDVLGLEGSFWGGGFLGGSWTYRLVYLLLIPPAYSTLLAIIGTLFGKGPYFRARVVKMWRRLLPAVLANRLFGAPD